MKSRVFPILIIFALFGLLTLLAFLQYQWLGQISDAEQIRLEERLHGDTNRFTGDFNREIQKIYYNFQLDAEDFEDRKWNAFYKRYAYWQTQTEFPGLGQDFYFFKNGDRSSLIKFDRTRNEFADISWNAELDQIANKITTEEQFSPILEDQLMLAIPVYKKDEEIEKVIIQTKELHGQNLSTKSSIKLPEKYGFLLIQLSDDLIKNQILPDLVAKYFSDSDGINYKISISDKRGRKIFQTHTEDISSVDATAKMFDLAPNDFVFFTKEMENSIANSNVEPKGKVVFSQRNTISKNEKSETIDEKNEVVSVNVEKVGAGKPRIAVFEGKGKIGDGIWTLNVQHTAGSLQQFIANTRNKNLAISFGILTLLAISMILIFISSQRVKSLAQKQMDFVSSVSHEFRTPLAVIYSAGENLSDGVIDGREKISSYGNLIKRDAKKLSGMVEQILEFAGANSGKRKYDFREIEISEIIEKACAECQTGIEENSFTFEKDIAAGLPDISGDEKALTLAIQNLINNSLKYSNGNKWLKISAQNKGENIRVTVEDKGIGIAEKDLRHIFEPFYRAENVVDEQISGNGLGLSLVKQIVEAHGGQISAESKVGKGSKFNIDLPVNN